MTDYPSKQIPDQQPPYGINPNYPNHLVPETNTLGIAGFVVSIAGCLTCGFLSIFGVILSAIGMGKAPRGFAIAGLLIGFLGLAQLAIVLVFLISATTTAKSAIKSSQKAIYSGIATLQLKEAADRIARSWEKEEKMPAQEVGDKLLRNKKDIWNQQLIYETDGESFSVRSIGPDGIANSFDDVVEGPFSSAEEARAISVENIERETENESEDSTDVEDH